jgi:hypothetical protein
MADPGTDQAIQQIRGGAQAQEYDKLNPAVQAGNQDSFLNYSKLGNLPNITGDLFKELGETVKAGVTGLDTFFKERIRGEATASVDSERERTQNWLQGGDAPENVKSSVNANRTLVNNLQTAANQGQISQAYYQMRLDTIARDLRSRYPGYREHIDNVIADLTGGTPANKIITDLFHNATNKSDPEQRLSEHLTKEIIDKMPGGGDYLAQYRQKNGKNPSNDEMMTVYGKWQTSNIAMQVQEKQIKLDQDQGKADEREVGKAAIQHWRFQASQQLQGNNSIFSKFKTQIEDAQTTLETSGTLNPDKQAQLMLSANAIEMKLKAQAEATISQFSDTSGQNRKGYLTPADVKNIRDEANTMGEMIRAGLGKDGKILPGLLGAVKEHLTAMSDFNQNELISKYPMMAAIAAARHQVGDVTTGQGMLVGDNAKMLGESIRGFGNYIKATMISGGKTPLGIIDDIKNRTDNPREQGIILKEGLDTAKKVILDPAAKDVSKTVLSLYNDEFISKINAPKADRQKLYAELSAPEMLNRMEQLRKEGHPELFDRYADWVYQTGSVLARPEIQTIATINRSTSEYKVAFDPKSLTFTGELDPNAPRTILGARKSLDPDAMGRTVVDRMNALSAPLIASLKARGLTPDAIETRLQETFGAANFDLAEITKQEEVKGEKTTIRGTPNFRIPEKKDESRVPQTMNEMHQEAAAQTAKGTLTPEDVAARPLRSEDLHVAKFNGKYVVVPNTMTEPEIKKYLEDKGSPAYGFRFDTEETAKLHLYTLQDAIKRNPGKFKGFAAP